MLIESHLMSETFLSSFLLVQMMKLGIHDVLAVSVYSRFDNGCFAITVHISKKIAIVIPL